MRLILALKLALARPRRLGRPARAHRADRGHARQGRAPGHPVAGLGRRLGRPRAARAHGRGDARRGRAPTYEGREMPSAEALAAAGLAPVVLAAKEGLALINGTQVSTAFALAGLFDAFRAARAALVTSAISTDAIMGSTAPLYDDIHQLRGHKGQILAARGDPRPAGGLGDPREPPDGDTRVQDPYCIRCQPQVTGACLDLLWQVGAHARDRGERGDRQPAGADGGRRDRLGRQLPRRAGRLRRRPDRARHRRDRLDLAAPHRADGRPGASATTCRRS